MIAVSDTTVDRVAYSPAEVADMLGVTTQTVYRMIQRKELVARRVGTRNYRVLASDLTRYLEEGR